MVVAQRPARRARGAASLRASAVHGFRTAETPDAVPRNQSVSGSLRGHLQLAHENGGDVPWCGPAALALATGATYAAACGLLRRLAPGWYPRKAPVVTAYWRDLLAALDCAGVPFTPVVTPQPGPTLLQLVRSDALVPGWYLARVTDHFLLLRCHGFGLASLHDNHHTGVLLTGRTHGRRKVTHLVRLDGGPLLARP